MIDDSVVVKPSWDFGKRRKEVVFLKGADLINFHCVLVGCGHVEAFLSLLRSASHYPFSQRHSSGVSKRGDQDEGGQQKQEGRMSDEKDQTL